MTAKEKPAPKIKWLSGTFACLSISFACAGFLCWSFFRPDELHPVTQIQSEQSIFLLSGAWIALIGAQLFRLVGVWHPLAIAFKRRGNSYNPNKSKDRAALNSGFKEHFVYLIFSLCSLSAIGFLSATNVAPFNAIKITQSADAIQSLHMALFVCACLSSFLPLLAGFVLHARAEAKTGSGRVLHDDVISRGSVIVTGVLATALVTLAIFAGAGKFNVGDNFGIYVTLVVMLIFLSFVATPHVLRYFNDRDSQPLSQSVNAGGIAAIYPERWASYLDSVLVRFVAPLSGATQKGIAVPHLLVVLLILPLSALGFVLASPFGLLPIAFAMLLVLALGRRWAWVEADRETASRVQSTSVGGIRVGFDNDLKDEALLGYASLFILVPLALYQIDGLIATQEIGARSYEAWLRFFGAELAKAVPFVDWWEIYQVPVGVPEEFTKDQSAILKHLTFAARAMVDLVIMAALLQAIGIWQRTRMQKALYNEGHVNAFDPFTEEDFFERGMKAGTSANQYVPKRKFINTVKDHMKKREDLGLLRSPYSARRLGELIQSENPEVRAGAEWMISEFGVLAGTPQEKLRQLAQQWGGLQLPKLAAQRTDESREAIRVEKLRFEQLLLDIRQELKDQGAYFKKADAGLLLGLLEEVQASPEFSYARILALELLATSNRSQFSLAAFTAHLFTSKTAEKAPEEAAWWAKLLQRKFHRIPSVYIKDFDLRKYVYEAIETYAENLECDDPRLAEVLRLLSWMKTADSRRECRDLAAEIATRLSNRC